MHLISLIIIMILFIYTANEFYYRNWKKELNLDLSFSQNTAFEGDSLHLTEVVSNRKLLPLPWLAIKLQVSKHLLFENETAANVSDDYYRNDLLSIMSYRRITRNVPFVCGKRGFYKIKSADLLSYNLLLTEKMVMNTNSSAFLLVYPKLIPADELRLDYSSILGEIISKRFINPDPFEFRGIREYTLGDDFKAINFCATAKQGELMVNTYEFTVSKEIDIYLNFEPYSSWVDYALFEKTICLCATLAQMFIKDGIPVRVISGSPDILTKTATNTGSGASQSHLFEIYAALAKLDIKAAPVPIAGLLPEPLFYANENKMNILISTFENNELIKKFSALRHQYSNTIWIMPYTDQFEPSAAAKQNGVTAWKTSRDYKTRSRG